MSPPQSWHTSVMSRQIQTIEQEGAHPLDVPRVGVVRSLGRFVRSPETHQIRRDDLQAGLRQHRDHRAVQVRPGRLAVQQQDDGCVGRAFAHIVDPQRAPFAIVNFFVVRGDSRTRVLAAKHSSGVRNVFIGSGAYAPVRRRPRARRPRARRPATDERGARRPVEGVPGVKRVDSRREESMAETQEQEYDPFAAFVDVVSGDTT